MINHAWIMDKIHPRVHAERRPVLVVAGLLINVCPAKRLLLAFSLVGSMLSL